MKKQKQKFDVIICGFKFQTEDADYDYYYGKSIFYKATKHMLEKAWKFKNNNERDYMYCEYDCTGSWEVRIKIKRNRNHFRIYYRANKDV